MNIKECYKYVNMQLCHYEPQANLWSINDKNHVVGSFEEHNNWIDYNYLFLDIPNLEYKKCLDFGCGPGRNLVNYHHIFKQIDGVDLIEQNIENAKKWIEYNKLNIDSFKLYKCNGYNLENIKDKSYDIIISTICLQHICVYEIRLNYFKEFYRILSNGGLISIQMGYGSPSPNTRPYYDNFYNADTTNRGCDVAIEDIEQVQKDLNNIGFVDFEYFVRPTGPGDNHPNWVFFRARKKYAE